MLKDFTIENEDIPISDESPSWALVINNTEDGGEVYSLYRNSGTRWQFWSDFYCQEYAMTMTKWMREYAGFSFDFSVEFPNCVKIGV